MYEVTVEIGGNPKEYWGKLSFQDKKGRQHCKEISGSRNASGQSNVLQALIASLEVLNGSCMLNIYSDEDYIVSAFQNGWIVTWAKCNWKNAKGRTIRNAEQWERVWELLTPHSRRVIKSEKKCQEA